MKNRDSNPGPNAKDPYQARPHWEVLMSQIEPLARRQDLERGCACYGIYHCVGILFEANRSFRFLLMTTPAFEIGEASYD